MRIRHGEIKLLPMVQRSRINSNGKASIIIRITIFGKNCTLTTGIRISPESWETRYKTILHQEANYKSLNEKLNTIIVDIRKAYEFLRTQKNEINPLDVKIAYLRKKAGFDFKIPNERTLKTLFKEFISKYEKLVEKEQRSDGTLRQWRSTMKKVIQFLQFEYKVNDISLTRVSPSFADKLYDYLTIETAQTLSEATAKKHIKKLKQIIKIGVKEQIIPSSPISDFKCGSGQKDITPLEYRQILEILNKDFGIGRLNEVRDAYIFQCLTGFAYQDLYALSPENIILVGPQKERWLCKNRGKTGVMEVVPMLPIIEQLIEKYNDHPICIQRNSLLPILSNVNYNGYLKEIAVICRIPRKLHTHLARHTFADLMLNLGMPLEDVSKMLGHKSIRTTQQYAKVRKNRIQKNFNEFVRPQIGLSISMIQQSKVLEKRNFNDKNINNRFYSTLSSGEKYTYSYTLTA